MLTRIKKINIIVIILGLYMNEFVYADGINIISTKTYVDNDIYYLDTYSELTLTKESYKALRQGISFEIH